MTSLHDINRELERVNRKVDILTAIAAALTGGLLVLAYLVGCGG